ncbi:MAG: hypothetical protein R6U70_06560 [Bacillota bacterium]
MSARQILLVCTGVGAILCLVLMGITVVRHVDGVEAVHGVNIVLREVSVMPAGDRPLEVKLESDSTTGHSYRIHSLRFVLRRGDAVVGARPEVFLSAEIPADEAVLLEIPVEPGSSFQDEASLRRLSEVEPSEWVVYGTVVVRPMGSKATVDKEFLLQGVGRGS